MTQTVGRWTKLGVTLRWVAAQRHDIPKAGLVQLVGGGAKLSARVAHARQVRHNREAEFIFQHRAGLGGAIARGAAGAVGHRNKIRRDALQARGRLAKGQKAGFILRWKRF